MQVCAAVLRARKLTVTIPTVSSPLRNLSSVVTQLRKGWARTFESKSVSSPISQSLIPLESVCFLLSCSEGLYPFTSTAFPRVSNYLLLFWPLSSPVSSLLLTLFLHIIWALWMFVHLLAVNLCCIPIIECLVSIPTSDFHTHFPSVALSWEQCLKPISKELGSLDLNL